MVETGTALAPIQAVRRHAGKAARILLMAAAVFVVAEGLVRWLAPQGVRVVLAEGRTPALPDPELGFVNRPGAVYVEESPEFRMEVRINAEGLRDATPHPVPKRRGVTRILLLGDSFAFGSGYDYADTFAARLERRLLERGREVDIVKAGVPAYDTRREARFLERLRPRYQPDLVLLAFVPNDLFTNEPMDEPGGPVPAVHETSIRAHGNLDPPCHLLTLATRLALRSDRLYSWLYRTTPRRDFFLADPPGEAARRLRVTEDLLLRMNDACRGEVAGGLVVLSIPQQFQVIVSAAGRAPDGMDVDGIDRRFQGIAARAGFRWLPLLPALAQEAHRSGKELYHRLDGHLNARGNRVVADRAADLLEGLLPRDGARRPGDGARRSDVAGRAGS